MIKIVLVVIVFAVTIISLRNINPEFSMLALVVAGLVVLSFVVEYLGDIFSMLEKIANATGIDNQIFSIILKVTAIGYVVEFGASTVEDFGFSSLAQKLIFIGKVVILGMSLPIIYAIFNLIGSILQ